MSEIGVGSWVRTLIELRMKETEEVIAPAGSVGFVDEMPSGGNAFLIVNVQDASASDVKKLIKLVKKEIYKKFHVKIEEEVLVL